MKLIYPLACALLLSACQPPPPASAYYNRGDPEQLIVTTTDTATVPLSGQEALGDLSAAIARDRPSHALLRCAPAEALCAQARELLTRQQIPTAWERDDGGEVALVYERITATDCENRYIDNAGNPHNLHMPTFGCSITGNMAQMVSDKRQFTSPGLLDFQDGEKTAQAYDKYLKPPAEASKSPPKSLLGTTSQ